jgi:phosphatidate cytidylyltransferase
MGGWWFFALLAVGGLLMLKEWCHLTDCYSNRDFVIGASTALVFPAFVTYFAGNERFAIGVVTLLFILSAGLVTTPPHKIAAQASSPKSKNNMSVGIAYVGMALTSLAWLRTQDDHGQVVIWTFFAVWAMDVGGYFAGKGIGGPKLAPKLSPKKTWAGLIGGMVLAAIVSLVIAIIFEMGDPLLMPFAGALIAVVAQLGDLYESAVKRSLNAKDSGNLIPGHGGILDRVDGLVFAAPIVAFAMAVPMLGKGVS